MDAISLLAKGDPVVDKLIGTYKSGLGNNSLIQLADQIDKKYSIEFEEKIDEMKKDMAKENEAMAKRNAAMAKRIAELESELAKKVGK